MLFRQIVDPKLAQYAYLVGCQRTGEALVIDPERDIDRYIAAAGADDCVGAPSLRALGKNALDTAYDRR